MKAATAPQSPLSVATIQLGLLVFAIYYTFIGGQTAQGIFDHSWRLITLWLTTIVIGVWLLWRWLGRYKIPRTPFDFPLLYLLMAWLLAAFFSVNPTLSQETLVFFVIYLFFFYIAVDLGRWPWLVELVLNAVIGVSGLVWTLALWQLSHWYQALPAVPAWLQHLDGPVFDLPRLSVLGNPNTMASFLALVLPVALYKLTIARKLMTRILLVFWITMLAGAAILTQSRGGILALMVGSGFYVLVWFGQKADEISIAKTIGPRLKAKTRPARLLLAVVLVGLFGLLAWLTFTQRGLSAGVNVRQQVMTGALKSLRRHPIFGSGPGTLGEELIRYQRPLSVIWSDAHNLPLTLIAETGLLGGAGLLWLAIVSARILWSTLRRVNRSQWNMSSLACVAALLGFVSHNMVDSLFKFPLIMLLVAVWAGFWIGGTISLPGHNPDKYWGYPVMAAAAFGLIGITFVGVRGVQNITAYNQAVQSIERDDWPTAHNHLKRAEQLAPQLPFYQRQLGLVTGYLSEQEPTYRPEAIARYQTAIAGVDQLAIDHANLGCLLWRDGQQGEAIEAMMIARDLQPDNWLYHLNLGHYLELSGNYEAAWSEYAEVLAGRPDYLQSSYWQQTEARASALAEIVQQGAEILGKTGDVSKLIRLHLYDLDFEAAWQVYENYVTQNSLDARSHLEKGRILLATDRLPEAQDEFEAALQAEPLASEAYLTLSKITLTQGKIDEAAQYMEAARYVTAVLFLEKGPEILYQDALVAEASGDQASAIAQYEDAFVQLTTYTEFNLPRYATEVARRRPLPVSHLPCLLWIYPTEFLVDIALAEGDLLESKGEYLQAGQVYRRLLRYEPTVEVIKVKLDKLCQEHTDSCDR